jgi:hypothetical protein
MANHFLIDRYHSINPTGHGVVFMSREGFVFCFVQPTGI